MKRNYTRLGVLTLLSLIGLMILLLLGIPLSIISMWGLTGYYILTRTNFLRRLWSNTLDGSKTTLPRRSRDISSGHRTFGAVSLAEKRRIIGIVGSSAEVTVVGTRKSTSKSKLTASEKSKRILKAGLSMLQRKRT